MNIHTVAKKISLLHSTSIETPTIFELTKEIVSQINVDWSRTDLKFLDPCCGRGTFLLAILEKLLENGHSEKSAMKMIYGVDINPIQTGIAKKALFLATGWAPNIYCEDSLTREWPMKFDVIVGNPPYQGSNDKGTNQPKSHNLWSKFVTKAITLAKMDGYVAFVTPDSWMSPNSNILDSFKKNSMLWINTDVSKYFSVGSSFTAWVLQKNQDIKNVQIDGVTVNLDNLNYLPRDFSNTYSIHDKVVNSSFLKLDILFDSTCHSDHKNKKVSKERSEAFPYEIYHTNAQMRYSSVKSRHFDDKKIIWTLSGYFKPFYNEGNLGTTEVCQYVLVSSKQEADEILSFLNSKLYRTIITTGKWSGFLNGNVIKGLPKLQNKIWTDSELYKLFNLTEEEINYIESNVK